jgi:hypothetical protein
MAEKHAKNRPATSTSWKKGTSGNPAGRPPSDKALATALREIVDPHELAKTLYTMALGDGFCELPNLAAIKLIFERLEGLAVASVSVDAVINPRLEILAELKRIADTEAANDA